MPLSAMPSADVIFDTLFAYQRSAVLKSAIELDFFTAIDDGAHTAEAVAKRSGASERGARILCDYLTVLGLLQKSDGAYQLTPESSAFLSKRSPTYLGTTAKFLLLPELRRNFDDLTEAVRRGGVSAAGNTVADENPIWVEFARAMAPMMMPAAHAIADLVAGSSTGAVRVLDIAAGHGMFGITVAQRNPRAEIVAVDWASVLAVAQENARVNGLHDRYRTLPGDAFKVDFGAGYDVALVTNFLHHFDQATCTRFLQKINAALKPGGGSPFWNSCRTPIASHRRSRLASASRCSRARRAETRTRLRNCDNNSKMPGSATSRRMPCRRPRRSCSRRSSTDHFAGETVTAISAGAVTAPSSA